MKTGWSFLIASAFAIACSAFAQDGAALYEGRCAKCHDSPTRRTPAVSALRAMSSTAILRALESGTMRAQAQGLSSPERIALASYLSSGIKDEGAPLPQSAFCSSTGNSPAGDQRGPSWNGFGAGLTNARFQSAEAAGLSVADIHKLRLKWAFGLGDVTAARGQPVVVGNRLFAASQANKLYSLDPKAGCVYWVFDTAAPIRGGVIVGLLDKDPAADGLAVFFGDAAANAYAVDFGSGKLRWKTHVEQHYAAMITAAPNIYHGVVYFAVSSGEEGTAAMPTAECCTFRGSVVALDAATGKQIWKTYTIAEVPKPTTKTKSGIQRWGPSGAGVWSTPTIDEKRDAIYVATGDNYSDPPTQTSDAVLALDRSTGKILWSRQITAGDAYTVDCGQAVKTNCPDSNGPDADFGQPPILVSLPNGKRALVIGQKSGVAHAIDPDQQGPDQQSKVLWQRRLGKGGPLGGSQWGSAADSDQMYVALSDVVFRVVRSPKNPGESTLKLDPKAGGGLFALRLQTGEQVWSAVRPGCGKRAKCSPAQSGAVTAIPGVVFSGSVDGHLRAYRSDTGEIIWDFDTVRKYDTVNGGKASGGSLDAGGPAVVGEMVYVNSGYGNVGGMPGNVLLAFSVDGK
ncbi:MAG: PQQ-binding-like beta-propeller repeat protein [Bryobacterales bacterium]|nr:PQQ-binding-like beta-propeller repeat protein [Bryobacterales bacterium]